MKEKSRVIRVPKSLSISQGKNILTVISAFLKNRGVYIFNACRMFNCISKISHISNWLLLGWREYLLYIEENFLNCTYLYMWNISCLHSDNLSRSLWHILYAKSCGDHISISRSVSVSVSIYLWQHTTSFHYLETLFGRDGPCLRQHYCQTRLHNKMENKIKSQVKCLQQPKDAMERQETEELSNWSSFHRQRSGTWLASVGIAEFEWSERRNKHPVGKARSKAR